MEGSYLAIIFIVILIFALIAKASEERESDTDYIGRIGEETTESIVKRVRGCEYTLKNLYIPTVNGNTTEIDLIAFTNRGLLVLETKNYSGEIHGNESDKEWYAAVHQQNNYFYNPLKQNATHTKFLKRVIKGNIPIYSIIVFSDRSSLEFLPDSFDEVYVCQMGVLKNTINIIFNENNQCISKEKLEKIYNKLKNYENPSDEVKRKHYEYVKSKRKQ